MYENKKFGRKHTTGRLRITKLDISGWMLMLPFVALTVYLGVVPMVRGLFWSFFDMQGYNVGEWNNFENYRVVLQDTTFLATLKNTFLYVFWSFVIGFLPPVIMAVMLNEIKIGAGFFKFSAYFPRMAPGIAISMLWYYLYFPNESGLLNMIGSLFGAEPSKWLQNSALTIPLITISEMWKNLGANMILYLSALQSVNRDLYEAALLDGAGFLKRFKIITLPQILPIMLINAVRQVIAVFQIMEQPLAMTGGGPNGASMSMGLAAYRYAFQFFKVGNALALNVIQFVILIVMTLIYFKVQKKVENDA